MRLVMTLVVRDEEELLAANLDYHLAQGVDLVLVTDHGSRDATPEILNTYVERGVARVFREAGEGLHQGPWMTRMARAAATEHQADWVFHNDADEFWWPLAGTLKEMLSLVPERYGAVSVPRHNFIPQLAEGPFWERMVVREASSQNLIGRDLEPKTVHRGHPEVSIPHGNHRVSGPALRTAPPVPLFEVFHFPARTYEQFERKVEQQARALTALREREPDVGRDQLMLDELHRRGELPGWFATEMLDADGVEAGLASGELVRDRRLERFMTRLRSDGTVERESPAQDLAVRRLAVAAFAAAESAARELEEARTSLEDRDRALQQARADLELLRGSRLFRWTRGMRRAYYRLRGRG
jgi:hypothetical protein